MKTPLFSMNYISWGKNSSSFKGDFFIKQLIVNRVINNNFKYSFLLTLFNLKTDHFSGCFNVILDDIR